MISFFIFIFALIVLLKSADWFVDSADAIARHLKLPASIIGATIVAFGTSAPELFVSGFAATLNQPEVILGNVFGSNVANTCLIFGLAIALHHCHSSRFLFSQIRDNLIALVGFAVVFHFFPITRLLAVILFLLFIAYQFYLLLSVKKEPSNELPNTSLLSSVFLFVMSLILLVFSSKFLVSSIIDIATTFGISKVFLSVFLVAFGTSLPELITTIRFVKKGHLGIVIGNVFGSNLFNLCFVLPSVWLINPVPFISSFYFEILLLFTLKIGFLIYLKISKKLPKFVGLLLLLIYLIYLILSYKISVL